MALALTGSPQITAAALDAAVNAELAANWFPLAGVTTNSNAAAGAIGEFISSTVLAGSGIALATNTATNITTISLTAGDWDVSGNLAINVNGSVVLNQVVGWISTTSAAVPTAPNAGGRSDWAGSATGIPIILCTGPMRLSLTVTTTVYLSGLVQWTVAQPGGYGFIGARRRR